MGLTIKVKSPESAATGFEPKEILPVYDDSKNSGKNQSAVWYREGAKSIHGKRIEISDDKEVLDKSRSEGIDYVTALAFQKDEYGLKTKWRGDLVVDIDDANSIPKALKEAKKIVVYLLDLGVPEEAVQVCYTGKKGYRIYVDAHAHALGLTEHPIARRAEFHGLARG